MPDGSSEISLSNAPVVLASASTRREFVCGKVTADSTLRCLIISEDIPFWLMVLCPVDWTLIHWMQFGSLSEDFLPLVQFFILHLKGLLESATFQVGSSFETLLQTIDVILISGSDLILDTILPLVISMPTLCIPSQPLDRQSRHVLTFHKLTTFRLLHCMTGGVTNGQVIFALRDVSLAALKSPLRWTLKHVLDFSLRPEASLPSPSFSHYAATEA